jgi:hypothetical protein
MVEDYGSKASRGKEALQRTCPEGIRGHPRHHPDPVERHEVRQQLDARKNHLDGKPLVPSAPHTLSSFRHRAYGLSIACNLPLSGLPPDVSSDAPDIRVHLQSSQKFTALEYLYQSPYLDESGNPILTVQRLLEQGFSFQYCDGTHFYLNQTGSEVFASWPDGLTLDDATIYLFGPILGFILRLRGVVSLHASGVLVEGGAIGVVGPPGAWKSTTAAAFVRSGSRALTDDVFPLIDTAEGFCVLPSYPGIRLWPESVQNLWGTADALPRLTMSWDKRYLSLENEAYSSDFRPVPIAAIYLLGERIDDPTAPYLDSPPSLVDLLANTYAGYAMSSEMRAHEFDVLARFMSSVPVRKVIPHADPSRLPLLCRLIEDDVRALRGG